MIKHLKSSFALILFAATLCSAGAQELKDRTGAPMKIGLQLYSVRDDCAKDLEGTLKAISAMGYKGVEFAGYYGKSAAELKKLLSDNGLACYGSHVDLKSLTGDNLNKTLEFAKELGCPALVVPWIPEAQRNSALTTIATAIQFNEIAKKAEGKGIIIGWHNEDYEFQKFDGDTIWQIFWSHASKQVWMEFDTGNAMSAGEQAAPYLLKYPQRVFALHIKDHSASNKNALLGEGDENWKVVIPIIKKRTATKYFIIEQEAYGDTPLACVHNCLENFKKLWAKF